MLKCVSIWVTGNVTTGDDNGSDVFWRLWHKDSDLLKRMDGGRQSQVRK